MSDIMNLIEDFRTDCPCGRPHTTAIRDVRIASGLVHHVGDILKENGFAHTLLLVADRNTLRAADGITESLRDFSVEYKIYDDLRVAEMEQVTAIEQRIADREISVLSVGTGSVNDPCRLAAASSCFCCRSGGMITGSASCHHSRRERSFRALIFLQKTSS